MNDYDDLQAACQSKDIDALWIALAQVSKREGAPLLADALLGDWHESHEDIVFELGRYKLLFRRRWFSRAAEPALVWTILFPCRPRTLHASGCAA